jgi:hypothetical protein
MVITHDDKILLAVLGIGVAAIVTLWYFRRAEVASQGVTDEPIYPGSDDMSPFYLTYAAPKSIQPTSGAAPCGCNAGTLPLLGWPQQLEYLYGSTSAGSDLTLLNDLFSTGN